MKNPTKPLPFVLVAGVALVLSAPAAAAPPRVAVLTPSAPWSGRCDATSRERDPQQEERCALLDALAEEARAGVTDALEGRDFIVMTRENAAVLLKEMGGQCTEGECEVETAKLLGADYVVSGTVTLLEGTWFVTLRLHEVSSSRLLKTSERVKARSKVELVEGLRASAEALVRVGMKPRGRAPLDEPLPAAARAAPPSEGRLRTRVLDVDVPARIRQEGEDLVVSGYAHAWAVEDHYDLARAPVVLEADFVLEDAEAEVVFGFSANRKDWDSGASDALTVNVVADGTVRIRSGMYKTYLANVSVKPLEPRRVHHLRFDLSNERAAVAIDGTTATEASLAGAQFARAGVLGLLGYRSAVARVRNVRLREEAPPAPVPSGLSAQAVTEVLRAGRPSLERCLAGPAGPFRGRRVRLTLTVNPSGVVTQPTLDDAALEASDLGECLKAAVRLLVFPKFAGEPQKVEIPMTLGAG